MERCLCRCKTLFSSLNEFRCWQPTAAGESRMLRGQYTYVASSEVIYSRRVSCTKRILCNGQDLAIDICYVSRKRLLLAEGLAARH